MSKESTSAAVAAGEGVAVATSTAPAGATRGSAGGGSSSRTAGAEVLRTAPMVRSMALEVQEVLDRAADDSQDADGAASREVTLAVSSEYEVRRDWPFEGIEILEHTDRAVRLDRFKDGAAVIAGDHFGGDLVGATADAWIGQDRRLYVRAKFGSVEEAERELTLIREGIRRNVSIRYRIHAMEHRVGTGGSPDVFRATDWEPIHVALVNDPEDPSVGFGREMTEEVATSVVHVKNETSNPEEGQTMTDQTPAVTVNDRSTDGPDRAAIEADIRKADKARVQEILALGRQFNKQDLALDAVQNGLSVREFKDRLLDQVKPGQALEATTDPAHLDMGEREAKRYSFFRALRYLEDRNNPRLADEAGLELEASRAIADATGEEPRGLFIPTDVLRSNTIDMARLEATGLLGQMTHGDRLRSMMMGRADMGATAATLGQNLVATDHLASSFIDVLRNTSAVMPRATILSGLQGNVEIPKKTVPTAGGWVATEGADTAADDITIGQETLTAKDIGAHVVVRRRLLLQGSPDVENMVRTDLAMAIALGIDAAAISGTGASGQPTGFLNDGSIGDWALATDPGTSHAADPQWSDVLALWKLVASSNALYGDLGWLMGANHAAHFLGRTKDAGSGRFIMEDLNSLMGYPVILSEQCPADTVAFLNFRTIVIGLWGGLDMLVDPYSQSKSASVIIRAIQTADTVVRQEAAVAAWQDSTVS